MELSSKDLIGSVGLVWPQGLNADGAGDQVGNLHPGRIGLFGGQDDGKWERLPVEIRAITNTAEFNLVPSQT